MARTRRGTTASAKQGHEKQRARVFWTGRSQVVRLPKAFRVATTES